MAQKFSTRQMRQHTVLPMAGNSVDEMLDSVLSKIDAQIAKHFEDRNVFLTDGGIVTFTGTQVQFTEALNLVINQKISGAAPQIISLGSTTRTISATNRMIYAIVNRSAGTATVTDDATTLPAAVAANQEVFLIAKRVDATDGTQRLYFRNGSGFNAGQSARLGSAGSGSGSGILTPVPGYKMLTADALDSNGTTDDTVDTTITNATYDAAKKLFRASCDKSKTVSTNAGTALSINLAPSYTVAINDIVYVLSGARAGQWRRIATVTNQTTYVLDSAFTGGNAAASDQVMVCQAIWTKDLVNFGSASELTRPRDLYAAATVTQLLVDYSDSLTASDDQPDFTQTARMVMSASNEGLQAATGLPASNLFTPTIYTRPVAPTVIGNYVLGSNTNTQRLFLVFFPSPTNGSVTTAANLLGYECNFYNEAESINGGVLDSAYGTSDNSSTPYNMTVSTSGGFTRADLNFSFNPSADPSGVGSQLAVKVDGQDVPKFISSAVTPSTQLSYTLGTDSNGLFRRVTFNQDLSGVTVDIMITRQFGMYDASFTQTNKLLALYDAIVGSSAQVTAGIATHSSLQAAHDAVGTGSNILILNNVSLSGNTTLSKRIMIQGKGGASVLSGNLTVASGAAGSIIKWMKVSGNIVFNAGADRCFMTECYQASGNSFSNDVSNVDNSFDIVVE